MSNVRARRSAHAGWDDAALIAAVLDGDGEAAAALYARYDPHARCVAARCTSSAAAAAEAAAAAWASAYEKLSTLRDPERFGPWLAAIVRNSAVAAQRAGAREVLSSAPPETPLSSATDEEGSDQDRLARARAALLTLSKRDRAALELSVYEQLPVAEVAAVLMIDVNTAYQVLSRARRRVRKAYLTPIVADDEPAACRACAAQTPDYVRGHQPVRAAVDAHVETCARCRGRLAEILAEAGRMKGPFAFVLPILLGLGRLVRWPRRFFDALWRRAPAQVAAIAGLLILAAGLLTGLSLTSSSGHTFRPASDIGRASPPPAPAPSPQASPARATKAPSVAVPAEDPSTRPASASAPAVLLAARISPAVPLRPVPAKAPPATIAPAATIAPVVTPAVAPLSVPPSTVAPPPSTALPRGQARGLRSPRPGKRIGQGGAVKSSGPHRA